jgi:glycosyltransferase involved in cell wall biosynthesis
VKILIDHGSPFLLAHGGMQVQIEKTLAALNAIGVDAEPLRWWDGGQEADIIHFFGGAPMSMSNIQLAHAKDIRVVMSVLLSGTGARPRSVLAVQSAVIGMARKLLPARMVAPFGWEAYHAADATILSTPWEALIAQRVFGAPTHKTHVLTNGVEDAYLESAPASRGPWLLCIGRITAIKRTLEVAQASVNARTPVWFIGRPMSDKDPYALRFFEFARQHPEWLRHESFLPLADLAQAYRNARGFVLLSKWETLSLAALEAAACGCPVLLADLPWAHSYFGDRASYCSPKAGTGETAAALRRFYDSAPTLPAPPRPLSWLGVVKQLKGIYEQVLAAKNR